MWKLNGARCASSSPKTATRSDPQREGAERGRLAQIVNDPEGFKKTEAARVDDEQHAKQMLALLPKAFLFDGPHPDGDVLKVYFKPNPRLPAAGHGRKKCCTA